MDPDDLYGTRIIGAINSSRSKAHLDGIGARVVTAVLINYHIGNLRTRGKPWMVVYFLLPVADTVAKNSQNQQSYTEFQDNPRGSARPKV